MINIIDEYAEHCRVNKVPFKVENSVLSYDETTLFCPAGMQQFKKQFKDKKYTGTKGNIQPCIRLNDINELGDGTHLAYFNMIGLFSFRDWSVEKTVNFWLEFIEDRLKLKVHEVTIHPKRKNWSKFYAYKNVAILENADNEWSDGEIGGYCTEFFHNGIEIGNIVNPLGECIDVGFGFERLDQLVNNKPALTKLESLESVIQVLIANGVEPSNKGHGYVLRKLLRELVKNGGKMTYLRCFNDELIRQEVIKEKYNKLKSKHIDKPKEWWFDTHGIDLSLI